MKAAGIWLAAVSVWGLMLAAVLGHGGRSALFMLVMLTFILLQGLAAKWIGPKQVEIRRLYTAERPTAGQPVAMRLQVSLRGGLPPVWLKLRDEFGGETAEYWVFAGFRRSFSVFGNARGLTRGIYGSEPIKASHTDLFGWFTYTRPCSAAGLLPVLPAYNRVAGGERAGEGSASEPLETPEEGFVLSGPPGQSVRNYSPGDPLKAVDWKISARRGELTVRAPEQETAQISLILLDTEQSSYEPGGAGAHGLAAPGLWPASGHGPRKPLPGSAGAYTAGRPCDAAAQPFETAVSTAAFLLADAAAQGHAVLFRHGGMALLCAWRLHSRGDDGPAGLAGLSLAGGAGTAAGSASAAVMLAEAARSCPGVPVTVITGTPNARLSAEVQQLTGRGASVRLICCSGAGTDEGADSASDDVHTRPARKEGQPDADVPA